MPRSSRRTTSSPAAFEMPPERAFVLQLDAFISQWGSPGSGDGHFDDPIGRAVDGDGNVFVGDFNSRIQKFACP